MIGSPCTPQPFAQRDRDRATLCRRDSASQAKTARVSAAGASGESAAQAADLLQVVLARLGGETTHDHLPRVWAWLNGAIAVTWVDMTVSS